MKKYSMFYIIAGLAICFTFLLCTNCFAATTSNITYTTKAGDVNRDGKVDRADAILILNYAAKLDTCPYELQKVADVNNDGKVNASDARKVLNGYNQKIKISYIPGDVNNDGKINSTDTRLVLRYTQKLQDLTLDQKMRADVNADGKVNSSDTRLIMNRVSGTIKAFPIEGDINSDGKISAADSKLALNYSAKLSSLTYTQKFLADINRDGKVNASDSRTILRIAAQIN